MLSNRAACPLPYRTTAPLTPSLSRVWTTASASRESGVVKRNRLSPLSARASDVDAVPNTMSPLASAYSAACAVALSPACTTTSPMPMSANRSIMVWTEPESCTTTSVDEAVPSAASPSLTADTAGATSYPCTRSPNGSTSSTRP